jgi:glycosyltransferase involved in cell wall biosynthesis
MNISVVINTKNAEATLAAALTSVAALSQDIVVVDMYSLDRTLAIAKQFGARCFMHRDVGYVEPARNFAISQAKNDWILVLDADEEIPATLATHLQKLSEDSQTIDGYFLPRQNIIFGRAVGTGWWPDFVLRFFRRGSVNWPESIHSIPNIHGTVAYLPADPKMAILHHNYQTVDDFIDRAQRYAAITAKGDRQLGDPLSLFFDEFLRRYYQWQGVSDQEHGLYLSLLQAQAESLAAFYRWQQAGFTHDKQFAAPVLSKVFSQYARSARYWEAHLKMQNSWGPLRWYWRLQRRLAR